MRIQLSVISLSALVMLSGCGYDNFRSASEKALAHAQSSSAATKDLNKEALNQRAEYRRRKENSNAQNIAADGFTNANLLTWKISETTKRSEAFTLIITELDRIDDLTEKKADVNIDAATPNFTVPENDAVIASLSALSKAPSFYGSAKGLASFLTAFSKSLGNAKATSASKKLGEAADSFTKVLDSEIAKKAFVVQPEPIVEGKDDNVKTMDSDQYLLSNTFLLNDPLEYLKENTDVSNLLKSDAVSTADTQPMDNSAPPSPKLLPVTPLSLGNFQ